MEGGYNKEEQRLGREKDSHQRDGKDRNVGKGDVGGCIVTNLESGGIFGGGGAGPGKRAFKN